MPLTAGARLGPYEIVALLGEGGMGQVYRARDSKLGREVALKILPDTFTGDPDRLARFKREAHVLASLNHPHIGAIYGFEDSSQTHALVLELVEGSTLAERISHGPIPLDEALPDRHARGIRCAARARQFCARRRNRLTGKPRREMVTDRCDRSLTGGRATADIDANGCVVALADRFEWPRPVKQFP